MIPCKGTVNPACVIFTGRVWILGLNYFPVSAGDKGFAIKSVFDFVI